MKTIKYYSSILVFVFFFGACTHEELPELRQEDEIAYSTQFDALKDFAIILSKAVVGNEEMREYLRNEALRQFDRDYDVFYPYVKDHVFSSGETFQEILSKHEMHDNQLEAIEDAVPKLTILVPDFSWINTKCFSVEKWDTSIDDLCVGFDDRQYEHAIYYNGEMLGFLPATSFPSSPVLIVKNNERISLTGSTKGVDNKFSFSNPAFDGSRDTKAMWGRTEEYWNNPEIANDLFSQTGNYISYDELNTISPSALGAYNEFGVGSTSGVQRDYVYYGMTVQNSMNGILNPFMRDMLYRFRLTPAALFLISDDMQSYSKDANLAEPLETGRGDRPEFTEAINRLWGNGKYEIRFQYFHAYPNSGASCIGSQVFSIAPSEIMYVDKCYHTFQWNFFGNNWSSYTITPSDIEPKWYYPGDYNNPLPIIGKSWNLNKESSNLFIKVFEYDPSGSTTKTETYAYKVYQSMTTSTTTENDSIKNSLGFTSGTESSWGATTSYTITTGSDELGDCEMYYLDNFILAPSILNGESGFQLKTWGNAYFAASFLPIDTRSEYQIQQTLLERRVRNH